jgi:hypothetical protein
VRPHRFDPAGLDQAEPAAARAPAVAQSPEHLRWRRSGDGALLLLALATGILVGVGGMYALSCQPHAPGATPAAVACAVYDTRFPTLSIDLRGRDAT